MVISQITMYEFHELTLFIVRVQCSELAIQELIY